MPTTYPRSPVVDDLVAEQQSFADLLARLAPGDWDRPSAAAGWTVRDQVAHLADTEEVAADTITGGPRRFPRAVSAFATAEEFTEAGCRRGRSLTVPTLISWWQLATARTVSLLRAADPDQRVDWGFGMPARTFAAARIMEHWAHRLDITVALGLPVAVSERLRHIAWLGLQSLPYALARARVARPSGHTLRLELTGPSGERAVLGPADATDVIDGSLLAWCRVAVRRPRASDVAELTATGPHAKLAIEHARAYL
jgi:uncharacterized protein (TIGR03084 family)